MDRRIGCGVCSLFLLFAAGGCSSFDTAHSGVMEGHPWSERVAEQVAPKHVLALRADLIALGQTPAGEAQTAGASERADGAEPIPSPDEALLLASGAIQHAADLAKAYNQVEPIELHNSMVRMGLRPRGLCYQYGEDMMAYLRGLRLKTFDLYWAVADRDSLLHAHSSVVVTARGRPFEEGMVLDPWRHAGRLRWARVKQDRYPWVNLTEWKWGVPVVRGDRDEADNVPLAPRPQSDEGTASAAKPEDPVNAATR